MGCGHGLTNNSRCSASPQPKATYAALNEAARQHLGDMFAVLWDEGAAMTLEEARRYAVSDSAGNAAPG
jgi:hypothetical protein